MDFTSLIKQRCSVRAYKDQKVEAEKIQLILEAGRIAPTAGNRQPQRILVIESEEGLKKLEKACKPHGPALAFIICADKDTAWTRTKYDQFKSCEIDASIVTDHMMLQAQVLGLSSCWLIHFDPEAIVEEYNIPENLVPVNILVVGYAEGEVKSPERHEADRKPLSEIVFHESF